MIRKRLLVIIGIFVLLGVMLFSSSCQKEEGAEKLKVVSTTNLVEDLVAQIGGDLIESNGLMGPGVDPHLYKASEGDVHLLSKADVIFYNGLHLEAKMGEIFEKLSQKQPVIAITSAVPKGELLADLAYQDMPDPHVWFNVANWKLAAQAVEKGLSENAPEHKEQFQKNLAALLSEMDALDAYIRKELNKVPQGKRVLVTAHDAFRYFGETYGVEVTGLQGINTLSEASAQDVQSLANLIVEREVPAIFVESSIPKRTLQAVQAASRAKGWDVKIGGELFSDALGSANTPEGTYIGMFRHNIDTIVSALLGKNEH